MVDIVIEIEINKIGYFQILIFIFGAYKNRSCRKFTDRYNNKWFQNNVLSHSTSLVIFIKNTLPTSKKYENTLKIKIAIAWDFHLSHLHKQNHLKAFYMANEMNDYN